MNIEYIGGSFAVLTFFHFVFDWMFQSSKTAINKHKNKLSRAIHCLEYSLLFGLLFHYMNIQHIALLMLVLFISHYIIDSYYPTYLFFKYIRQPYPEYPTKLFTFEVMKKYVDTPIGAILMVTVDQLLHLGVLLWICYFIVS